MKIRNTEDVLQYPETYDFLTEEQQEIIVNYMNAVQDLANRYYETHLDNESDDYKHNIYLKLYNQTMSELTGAKSAYATAGIHVEYNWPGHYHKWILATQTEAQEYLDAADDPYPENCGEEEEEVFISPMLLSYEQVF